MDEPKIPGTRVPDNPIHRASLWVESLKYAPDVRAAGDEAVERLDDFAWRAFVEESGLPITVEQLVDAVEFYGENLRRMIVGNRLNFMMPMPGGEGMMDLGGVFKSVWFDGFEHGAGTALGKRGLSNQEIREGVEAPPPAATGPLLQEVFNALAARGWRVDDEGVYVDPEGNRYGTLEAAITAQTFREIADA